MMMMTTMMMKMEMERDGGWVEVMVGEEKETTEGSAAAIFTSRT